MSGNATLPTNPLAYLKPYNLLKLYTAVGSVLAVAARSAGAERPSPPRQRDALREAGPVARRLAAAGTTTMAGPPPGVDGLLPPQRQDIDPRRQQASGRPTGAAGGASSTQPRVHRRLAGGAVGTLPAAGLNGPGVAWEIPGLGRRKALLRGACERHGVTDTLGQAQILAAALIEGDLSQNTDPDKQGPSQTHGVFNLNTGMMADLGLLRLAAPMQNVREPQISIDASVRVIAAAIEKYGLEGFMLWQRGGQTLKDNPATQAERFLWPSYAASFRNTVTYLMSGTGLHDDFRYAEVVPGV